jgi:hypothetical protein
VNREREELIDFILGEGPEPLVRDPAAEAELRAALAVVRTAAAEGWGARGRRLSFRRPALAAAAVLLVAATAFLLNGAAPRAVYEPDTAFGALLPEETDSRGSAPEAPSVKVTTMRAGEAAVSPLGAERPHPLAPGDEIPYESEIRTPKSDAGARIDLPDGGILFVGPLSTVRLRRHEAGGPALRLLEGVAATVAGRVPLHLAVHETDLLVRQESGALLMRQSPGEVIALRGAADLLLGDGKRFPLPPGERLPAACAREPFTSPATAVELDLDWYLTLAHGGGSLADVSWEKPGCSEALRPEPGTMLFVRLVPSKNGRAEVSYGGATRTFELDAGAPLALRLKLEDLGPGPRVVVTPAGAIREARLFRPGR